MRRNVTILSMLLVLAVASPLATRAYDGGERAAFGGTVVVSEGIVYVAESENLYRPGTVYVYARDAGGTWKEASTITAPDAEMNDSFGAALAIDGGTMLVSAPNHQDERGVVYVFEQRDGAWMTTGRFAPQEAVAGDRFGMQIALDGDAAVVSSAAGVYAFHRDGGNWSPAGRLQVDGASAEHRYGAALALSGDVALVSAPGWNDGIGGVFSFRYDAAAGAWRQMMPVSPQRLLEGSAYGAALYLEDNAAFVGAPSADGSLGTVFTFAFDPEAEEWMPVGQLHPFDGSPGSRFGSAITRGDGEVWVAAPGGRFGRSRVPSSIYRLHLDESTAGWGVVEKVTAPDLDNSPFSGGTIDVDGRVAAVGLTRADNGAGTALILGKDDTGVWLQQSVVRSPVEGLDSITGGQVPCDDGKARLFACDEVDLMSFLPVKDIGGGRGIRVNDLWGWTDPDTGKEYALVGRLDGTAFIDVSDPAKPAYLGNLPKTEGSRASVWRDMKVYQNHVFIVADGAGAHGVQIFDLTQLRDVDTPPVTFEETAHYDGIFSAHNIVINEDTGFAYTVGNSSGGETCGGGLHMIDIRQPEAPRFAGCFADPSTGRASTGYTHDAQCVTYKGPDDDYRGREICFDASETALGIADVTDKAAPKAISVGHYPNVGYTHQGWLTEDQRYFYVNDELDEIRYMRDDSGVEMPGTRTLIWDVSDLDDPQMVSEYFGTTRASDHNLYVKGNVMYQSNYRSGLRVIDVTNPVKPVEIGSFDTVPFGGNGPGMGGSWSNYPFFKSGIIVVTSGNEGVFILKKKDVDI